MKQIFKHHSIFVLSFLCTIIVLIQCKKNDSSSGGGGVTEAAFGVTATVVLDSPRVNYDTSSITIQISKTVVGDSFYVSVINDSIYTIIDGIKTQVKPNTVFLKDTTTNFTFYYVARVTNSLGLVEPYINLNLKIVRKPVTNPASLDSVTKPITLIPQNNFKGIINPNIQIIFQALDTGKVTLDFTKMTPNADLSYYWLVDYDVSPTTSYILIDSATNTPIPYNVPLNFTSGVTHYAYYFISNVASPNIELNLVVTSNTYKDVYYFGSNFIVEKNSFSFDLYADTMQFYTKSVSVIPITQISINTKPEVPYIPTYTLYWSSSGQNLLDSMSYALGPEFNWINALVPQSYTTSAIFQFKPSANYLGSVDTVNITAKSSYGDSITLPLYFKVK
ncbi:MAG: hypothetical protein QM528_07940 [Phycisphaerales bacterium]|nr:hypothetical protein [Phycisphaerales bacterium]